MAVHASQPSKPELLTVDDVDGIDPPLGDAISRWELAADEASELLRATVHDLLHDPDPAWRHFAMEVDDATLRFSTSIRVAAARLHAEHGRA